MSDKQSAEEWIRGMFDGAITEVCDIGDVERYGEKCRDEERERVKGIVWDEIECICDKCDGKCPRCTVFDRIAKEARHRAEGQGES